MIAGEQLAYPAELIAITGEIEEVGYPRQGCTSEVSVVTGDRGIFAVKYVRGQRFCSYLAHEYKVLQALAGTGLPVSKPYSFVGEWTGTDPECWMVMEHLPGEHIRSLLTETDDPAARHEIIKAFGKALADIQATPPPLTLVEASQPWLERMFCQAWHNLSRYEVEESQELLAALSAERPKPEDAPQTLIHGDFTIDNVLFSDGRVTGIIDWAGGDVGDRRFDLAVALEARPGLFTPVDKVSFYEGYGGLSIDDDDYMFFTDLNKFF